MKKSINYFLIFSFLVFQTSCSSFGGVNDYLFGNKFFYKNGYESVQLSEQDVKKIPNKHPIKISVERMEGALRLILVKDRLKTYPLVTDRKLSKIATGLSEALSEAKSDEDVVFTIEGWYLQKYVSKPKVTSGRVFYNKSGLNIIFGSILRKGNMSETDPLISAGLNPDLVRNPYVPGSRTETIKNPYILSAPPNSGVYRPRQAKGRIDWLVFTTKALQPRGEISDQARTSAYRNNIQVQDLHTEVKKLKSELQQLRGLQRQSPYQNQPYPYGYPPYQYQNNIPIPPNQQYYQNTQPKYNNTRTSANQENMIEAKALKSMREKGIISEQEFRKRLKQLGF
ncbi:MAG: hypothetical protein CMP41_01655 [Rickettsiales bacterium]|nr:hypothetical protein [Rickettsiales bacterium]